jgi:hypothetical protein
MVGDPSGAQSSSAVSALAEIKLQLGRAQAALAQWLRDSELPEAQYTQVVGLQAALDQLEATLQRWEPLTIHLTSGAAIHAGKF